MGEAGTPLPFSAPRLPRVPCSWWGHQEQGGQRDSETFTAQVFLSGQAEMGHELLRHSLSPWRASPMCHRSVHLPSATRLPPCWLETPEGGPGSGRRAAFFSLSQTAQRTPG